MQQTLDLLAFDLGASNGRAIIGRFDEKKLQLQEIHRFENHSVCLNEGYYWDILHIFQQIKDSLSCCKVNGYKLKSMAIDGWGLDFALLDRSGQLCQLPRSYRDPRSQKGMELLKKKMSAQEMFRQTGSTLLMGSSICQLYDMVCSNAPELEYARTFLMLPDLLRYYLCGEICCEYTNATTTQMLLPDHKGWNTALMRNLGIPEQLFSSISLPGSCQCSLRSTVQNELGLEPISVELTASHDTAAAFAAVVAGEKNRAFLSSGTWSLLGIQSADINLDSLVGKFGFSYEGCSDGTVRLMKNVPGLWILQECRREWSGKWDWQNLMDKAKDARAFASLIHPEHPMFFGAGKMCARIQEYCRSTQQYVPQTPGEFTRCILESLALVYKSVFRDLEIVSMKKMDELCIVGGGSKNRLLNTFTAGAIGKTVITGPSEASAVGNLLVQLKGQSGLTDADIEQIIKDSFLSETYEPTEVQAWDEAFVYFEQLKEKTNFY